jgi:hypothetical protein
MPPQVSATAGVRQSARWEVVTKGLSSTALGSVRMQGFELGENFYGPRASCA